MLQQAADGSVPAASLDARRLGRTLGYAGAPRPRRGNFDEGLFDLLSAAIERMAPRGRRVSRAGPRSCPALQGGPRGSNRASGAPRRQDGRRRAAGRVRGRPRPTNAGRPSKASAAPRCRNASPSSTAARISSSSSSSSKARSGSPLSDRTPDEIDALLGQAPRRSGDAGQAS